MKSFLSHPIVRVLSSLQLAVVLLIVFATASAVATFIEVDHGRVGAQALVYNARWFEAVIALLVVNLILALLKRFPYRPRKTGFVIAHISFIVILISAGVTRYFGYEGIMPIREGERVNYAYSARDYVQASLVAQTDSPHHADAGEGAAGEGAAGDVVAEAAIAGRDDADEAAFPVRLYKAGTSLRGKKVDLGGQRYQLGVADYWPRYTETYDEGEGGVPAIELGYSGEQGIVREVLLAGRRERARGVGLHFVAGAMPALDAIGRHGDLRVRVGGESCRFQVVPPLEGQPVAHECGNYRLEITEFQSDFKVGQQSDPDGPLLNPMIRLEITGADGQQDERVLFAFYPEFDSVHGGEADAFADLDLFYDVEQEVVFATAETDSFGLVARAPFPLQVMRMSDRETVDEIPAGETFAIATQVLYRSEAMDFSFAPIRILQSAVRGPALSDDPDDRPAAQLVITDEQGQSASAVVIKDGPGTVVTLDEREIRLSYGPIVLDLPYSLHLDDFVLETYPGSDNPASYESHVRLFDEERGIDGHPVRIYMNHPLSHRGSKHFQSSYDPDRHGTVLSVNHDPGKWPTYIGYTLLCIGFLLIIFKDLIWPKKRSAMRPKYESPKVKIASLLVCGLALLLASPGLAQEDAAHGEAAQDEATVAEAAPTAAPDDAQHAQTPDETSHDHAHAQPTNLVLSDTARQEVATMIVQDYRGRMKPLDTLCREMVIKITKKSRFEGREAVDTYLDWVVNPARWWEYPLLSVKFRGLHDLLGISREVRHVAATSLYDEEGNYVLEQAVERAHRTPDRERTQLQRKLILFDERFNLFYLTLQGQILRLYPVPGDENNSWVDIHDIGATLTEEQFGEYQQAFMALFDSLQRGNAEGARHGAQAIKALQTKYGSAVLPGDAALRAELLLNSWRPFLRVIMPYFLAAVLFLIAYAWSVFKRRGEKCSFRQPVYALGFLVFAIAFVGHLGGYVMRWIASGRAPLSNGHESLLFIALTIALAGLVFELIDRRGSAGGLASFLTAGVLGISLMATFDPAIGPLVPVLASFWLNIHVTVITGSYGFLGLSMLLGMLMLLLYLAKGPKREHVREAINRLYTLNQRLLKVGIGLLAIGTLLGGVWANESWGRYWGWDSKETWSLVTILVYSVVLHFRWIPALRGPWPQAAGSFAAIASIVMTYFGVNYFLTGLHSYASGDVARVPDWVYIGVLIMATLIGVSGLVRWKQRWTA